MIAVVVTNKVEKENRAAFVALALKHREETRRYDVGCVAFEVTEPQKNGTILFFELWETEDDLDAHAVSGARRDTLAKMTALRADKKMKVYKTYKTEGFL